MDIKKIIAFLRGQGKAVEQGEIKPINLYRQLRGLKDLIDEVLEEIDSEVRSEISNNPREYLDFSLSMRSTYQYKQCPAFEEKQKELKAIEEKIKLATQMHEKGDTYVDADGVIIEPVEVKYTEILTYKPKR